MATVFLDCTQAVPCMLWESWFRVLACQRIGAAADDGHHAFPEQTKGTFSPSAVLLRPSPVRAARESCTNSVFQTFSAMVVSHISTVMEIVESQNHRMVRVGTNLKDHLVPTPLP